MNTKPAVRLPHTGLWVPDQSLDVIRYKEHTTGCGVAFTAVLRHHRTPVGAIENHGTGGMTFFYPTDHAVFGETHLEVYAARCRTAEGEPATAEDLLNELVEEGTMTRTVARAERRKRLALRRMDINLGAAYPNGEWESRIPTTDAQWKTLTAEIVGTDGATGDGQWWQAWHNGAWRDVTARPAGVGPDLYL